jgi:hypothetical protein
VQHLERHVAIQWRTMSTGGQYHAATITLHAHSANTQFLHSKAAAAAAEDPFPGI